MPLKKGRRAGWPHHGKRRAAKKRRQRKRTKNLTQGTRKKQNTNKRQKVRRSLKKKDNQHAQEGSVRPQQKWCPVKSMRTAKRKGMFADQDKYVHVVKKVKKETAFPRHGRTRGRFLQKGSQNKGKTCWPKQPSRPNSRHIHTR